MPLENDYLSEEIELPLHGTLFDAKSKCLFVYKAKRAPTNYDGSEAVPTLDVNKENRNVSHVYENGNAGEEFAGMPLECPFDLNVLQLSDDSLLPLELSKPYTQSASSELCYVPFSATEARAILNDVSLKHPQLPIFVFCNGEDSERTSLLGIQKIASGGLIIHSVTEDGPFPVKHEDIQLDKLKQRMSFYCNNSYKTIANAVYTAYQSETLDDEDPDMKTYMRLAFSWENPRKTFETPLLPTGSIDVTLRPAYGETCSPNYDLWVQLKALRNFVTGVKSKEVIWSSEAQSVNLIEEVDKLLTASFEEHWQAKSCFTYQLWELLSVKCASFQSLVETLNYVLRKTRKDNILIASGRNKTKLDALLADMSRDIQLQEDVEPLHLLIDMGVQKLKDDCIDFLAGQGVITEKDLLQFLPKDGADMEESLEKLEATLYAIEALTLCHRILKLDYLALKFVVLPLLEHYTKKKGSEFTFQINAAMLPYFFENKTINVDHWRVQFICSDPEYSVKFVCLLKPVPVYSNPDDETKVDDGPVEPLVDVEYLLSIQ